MVDDAVWKKRFLAFTLVRLFAVAMVLGGAAIATTDVLREGGWPLVGAILIVAGVIDALFAPKLLRKAWEEEDRRRG